MLGKRIWTWFGRGSGSKARREREIFNIIPGKELMRALSPPPRILLLESTPDQARILRYFLERNHCSPIMPATVGEALELLNHENDVELIFSNIFRPDVGGLEFLKSVRDIDFPVPIPFVFLSADSNAETIQRAFELGADDYLLKPISFEGWLFVIFKMTYRYRRKMEVSSS